MYTNTHSRHRRSAGFSLVEVLICITVVSVMVALLMPALKVARQMSDGVRCSSTLRSWGVAFTLYASDNRGYYPIGWINNSDHWCSIMAPYVQESWLSYEETYLGSPLYAKRMDLKKAGCPGYANFTHPSDPLFRAFPYSYNSARFDYPYSNPGSFVKGTAAWPAGWRAGINWDSAGVAHRYNTMTNVEKVVHLPPTQLYTKSAQCVSMFCGVAGTWRYFSLPYEWWFSKNGGSDWDVRTGNSGLGGDSPNAVVDAHGIKAYDENGAPTGIHNGKDGYLFMDGHVELLKLSDPAISRYVYNQIPNNNNPYR
jgi:prepilin-type N-terminal cleavage/methylation domain-containing protein/prepilin-type processing-associated H-X9-DG protein